MDGHGGGKAGHPVGMGGPDIPGAKRAPMAQDWRLFDLYRIPAERRGRFHAPFWGV
jgi:hypothetical protein